MSPSTFFVAAAAALVVAASAADPIKFDGYAVDVACVSNTGSKSFDKGVSVLAKPEEHTKNCLMMPVCIKDLVLLEAPATEGSDYTIKYHLAADLLAVAAAQIKASTKTADVKVQVEGCLTGATTDITPGGAAKQSVPILGKCPTDVTTTAAADATTTAAPGAGNKPANGTTPAPATTAAATADATVAATDVSTANATTTFEWVQPKTPAHPPAPPTQMADLPGCHNNGPATATGCGDCAFVFIPSVKRCVACIRENQTQRITKDMLAALSPPAEWCAGGNGAPGLAASIAAVLVGAIAAMFF